MRSSWSKIGPESSDSVLTRDRKEQHTHTHTPLTRDRKEQHTHTHTEEEQGKDCSLELSEGR